MQQHKVDGAGEHRDRVEPPLAGLVEHQHLGQVGAEPGCGRDAEVGEADDTSPSTAGCGPGNECERGVGDAAPSCGDSPGPGRYSNAGEATAGNQRAEELVERDEPTALPDTGRAGAGSVHQPGGSSVGEPQFALVSEL